MAILSAAGGAAIGLSGQALDTTTMLGGGPLPEPILIGAPTHVQALRAVVQRRANC
jgi:hypothetical protein